MKGSLFGTDGIRGQVGEEPVTPATLLKLGWAAGRVFVDSSKGHEVLIGKDTRVSGYLLESALEAGFSSAGVNISLLGPMPTPGVAWLTRTARDCIGVMISASHNPFHDNGIKFFSPDGAKLNDGLIAQIDEMMEQPQVCVASAQLGKAKRFPDAHGRYIEHCKSTFDDSRSLSGLRIVVDCANGAAYDVAPRVFEELGADVIAIANHPDGFNINHNCGSTDTDLIKTTVQEAGADVGIALDGDADRVLLVDRAGNTVDGDQILYILARYRKSTQRLSGGVVGTLMTNLGLEHALNVMSIPFLRTRVGDRYIHEALVEQKWNLGGETSGHIICLDKSTTGDGIVAALEVLEVMLATGQSLGQLMDGMQVYPQQIINVPVGNADRHALVSHQKVLEAVTDAQGELNRTGRVVLRPSGTESVVRVMTEGADAHQVQLLARQIAEAVAEVAAGEPEQTGKA